MFGNTSFGFSGAGGGGGGGTIGGGGTLNYLCKFTPDGLNIGNSMFFDNGISVGLGTITPDASAILDLTSTTQGFLSPRMTTVERDAIVAPVNGLFIYNTSSSFFNYWNGSTWIQIDTSTGGDVSGSGTTNRAVLWTDGGNSVIGDATWYYSTNDYLPVTTGSNIGDATHRIGTIFMASVFDYSTDLNFYNGTLTTMTLTGTGRLGIGGTATDKLTVISEVNGDFNGIRTYSNNLAQYSNIGWGGMSSTYHLKLSSGASQDIILTPANTTLIQGINSVSTHYALKIQSSSTDISTFRNDGYVNVTLGNITFGVHTAAPTVPAIFMGVTPAASNYTLAYNGGNVYINGDTVNYSVAGSVKGTTNATYTQFLHPFSVGSIVPSGANAFVVSGESYLQGSGSTSATYALKVDNSAPSPLLYVRNDGNAFMGDNTAVSVASPIALDLGGQYSSTNGLNPKLIIYNNNNTVKAGLGVSYNGSGQTEMFTYAASAAFDYTWYHGSSALARLSPNTLTLHRNEPNLTYGYAINFDLNNSVAAQKTYAVVSGGIVDNTNGSEDGFLKFFTTTAGTPTEKMVINEFGNVGIGTTSPTAKLQLEESSFTQEHLKLSGADFLGIASSTGGISMLLGVNTGNNRQLWIADSEALTPNATNSTLAFQLGGTNVPNIQALSTNATILNLSLQANGGNVGIGTISPLSRLHAEQNFNDIVSVIRASNTSTGTSAGASFNAYNGTNALEFGILSTTHTTYTGYGAANDVYFYSSAGAGKINIINASGNAITFGSNAASQIMFINPTAVSIGLNSTGARLYVKGGGATSANYALKVDNSASSPLLYVRNDQFVGIGTSTEVIGNTGHKFEVYGTNNNGLGLDKYFSAAFSVSNSFAEDMGAGIALGGKYNTAGNINPFAGINGVKLNAVDGNFDGRFNIWVRNGSTANVSFTSFSYGSKVRNGMGIKNPTALLHLDGDNADVFISQARCINTTGYAGKFYANIANKQDNIGIYSEVANGLSNYAAILMGGNVGIDIISPTAKLHVEGDFKTAQPSANGAGAWKFGKVLNAASVLDGSNYVEVEIDGNIYKLALIL